MKVNMHGGLVFITQFHFSVTNTACFLSYRKPLTSVNKHDNASFHGFFSPFFFSILKGRKHASFFRSITCSKVPPAIQSVIVVQK